MGNRLYTVLIILCALALGTLECEASSAADLYSIYDKELIVEIPEEVISKISTYDNAKKYAQKYTYVINSEYDKSELEYKLKYIDTKLKEISEELVNGYNKPQSMLYQLESEYYNLLENKNDILKSMNSHTVAIESISVNEIPKYSEYKEALQIKNDILSKCEIGIVKGLDVPVQSSALHIGYDNEYAIYKVIDSTGVLSVFNGIVDSISEDCVVINNHNNIKTYIKNLSSIDVEIGDTVYQHQRIGYSDGMFVKFAIEIDNEFHDISILFNEEI